MTALERPIMGAVASGAVIRDLLDTARSSLDELAEQTALAMDGTWVQQVGAYEQHRLASQYWTGTIGERLAGDPRLSQGVRPSAEGIDLILAEAGRFADDIGDASLAGLLGDARKRVLDGVAPVSIADVAPVRRIGSETQVPLEHGPVRLQAPMQTYSSYVLERGSGFDSTWSANQIIHARRAIDHSALLADRMPETALLRRPAEELASGTLATLAASRALAPNAQLSTQDLASIAHGVEGLAERISAIGRTMLDDGVIGIVPDSHGRLRLDRAAFDAHVAAVDHALTQMTSISTASRAMAPPHALAALDALDTRIAQLHADADTWTSFIRGTGEGATADLTRHTAPSWLDSDAQRKVLRLHGSRLEQVEGRFRTKDVMRPEARAPFVDTAESFADTVTAFRTLAGEAAVGSAAEVAGATSVASAHDAIALARERYAAALAAVDAPA